MKWKEIPVLPAMRTWGARSDKYQFIITFDDTHPEYKYRASWKHYPPVTESPRYLGSDAGFLSFQHAEEACKNFLRSRRQ